MRPLLAIFAALMLLAAVAEAAPTVGVEGEFQALLPVADLVAQVPDRHAPLQLRIASARPHGTRTQYEFRYIGQVPGKHDLRKYLARRDGFALPELPPMEVEVAGILPPEHRGEMAAALEPPLARFGGYPVVLGGLALAWLAAGYPLFLRGRRRTPAQIPAPAPPATWADRLGPLLQRAERGELSVAERAEFERLFLGQWREELGLADLPVSEAVARLRDHPQAGAHLRALEDWLHRPHGTRPQHLGTLIPAASPNSPAP